MRTKSRAGRLVINKICMTLNSNLYFVIKENPSIHSVLKKYQTISSLNVLLVGRFALLDVLLIRRMDRRAQNPANLSGCGVLQRNIKTCNNMGYRLCLLRSVRCCLNERYGCNCNACAVSQGIYIQAYYRKHYLLGSRVKKTIYNRIVLQNCKI